MKKEADKNLRVAIYCRVATDNQANDCMEAQKTRLRAFAEQRGYTVVAEVAEVATGLSLDRPGIREFTSMARRRAIDEILIADISRIGRNTLDVLCFARNIHSYQVVINTPQGNPLTEFEKIMNALKN